MTERRPESVLVIAAHPDDEILGCGATLARHAAAGDQVRGLIIAEGATSRAERRDVHGQRREIRALQRAAREAARELGLQPPELAGFPDNRLDSVQLLDIVKRIELTVESFRPTIVYTHHGGDLNIDHKLVFDAVVTACRPLPGSTVRAIYAFETVSSTEWGGPAAGMTFHPSRFVGIEDFLDAKMRALQHYESEIRPFPHPRSFRAVEALAVLRGSSVGIAAAEAFVVVRDIQF